jgi:hypothetical protein
MNKLKICDRCDKEYETFWISDTIWNVATDNTKEKFLCKNCVALRLGRRLRKRDYLPDLYYGN